MEGEGHATQLCHDVGATTRTHSKGISKFVDYNSIL